MKLTKPMIRAFTYIIKGENTLTKLAKALNKSIYWTDIIISSLEKEGIIRKKQNFQIKGSRFVIEVANTYHSLKFKELLFEYSGISFENLLSDGRLLFLAAISEDWTSTKMATQVSGISKYIVDKYRPELKNRGVIIRKGCLYTINVKAWPLLKEFVVAYKNYSTVEGNVKWKYQNEILFEVNDEQLIKGSITGLAAYKHYGVFVRIISALCFLPKKKFSKEEIFVHSLFEVDDPRTLHLALTFYIKNKLKYEKVFPIAMKYGKYTMFESFVKLLKIREDKVIKLEALPTFDGKDFKRIAHMYDVKNV